MSGTILASLAISLALTIVLETGVFLLAGKRNKKDLLLLVLVNVLTNPIVVSVYWLTTLYTNWNSTATTAILELFAVLTEGYFYRTYGSTFRRPFLFSIIANMISYWMGVLIQILF